MNNRGAACQLERLKSIVIHTVIPEVNCQKKRWESFLNSNSVLFGRNMTRLEKNKKRCNLLRNRSNTKKEYKEKKKRTPKIFSYRSFGWENQ